MAVGRQSANLPPAQPSYILRGHASQIHSVQFVRQNTRLVTGDADGWVIYWKLETKRALAVWKAHDSAILGTAEWGHDKIITHGRDNSLRIWQIRTGDENTLSTALPAEVASADRPVPWLLHILPVNTLNFCAFSMCYVHAQKEAPDGHVTDDRLRSAPSRAQAAVLVAVPARDDKKAEVYQFPDERLKYVVPRAQSKDTGMVMAVKLIQQLTTQRTMVITGYEGGLTAVHVLPKADNSSIGVAQLVYISQPHTQPILSLDILPDAKMYFTSGADAVVAAHRIPDLPPAEDVSEETWPTTRGAENESQGSAFTETSRPVSQKNPSNIMDPGEDISSAPADDPEHSDISIVDPTQPNFTVQDKSDPPLSFTKQAVTVSHIQPQRLTGGLSSLLSTEPSRPKIAQPLRPRPPPTVEIPHKVNNTKHAGQQSLAVRSDGRLLATGGWDSRVRIYSAKTLKEMAVLKWHKEGVYAVAFGEVLNSEDVGTNTMEDGGEVVKRETGLSKVQRQREEKMQIKHWVAAGAKDGKVSLWEVF